MWWYKNDILLLFFNESWLTRKRWPTNFTYLFFSFYVQFICAAENVNLLKFIFFFFRFFTFWNQTTPTSKWWASFTWSRNTKNYVLTLIQKYYVIVPALRNKSKNGILFYSCNFISTFEWLWWNLFLLILIFWFFLWFFHGLKKKLRNIINATYAKILPLQILDCKIHISKWIVDHLSVLG